MLGFGSRTPYPLWSKLTCLALLYVFLSGPKGALGTYNVTRKEIVAPNPLALSCQISNVTSLFELYWNGKLAAYARSFENGSIIHSHNPSLSPHFEVSAGNTLTFVVEKSDIEYHGAYICVSKQSSNKTIFEAHYQVEIYGGPTAKIRNDITVVSLYVTETYDLTCLTSGNPSPSLKWLKDGAFAFDKPTFSFSGIKLEEAGIYTCVAENVYGNATISVKVEVKTQVPGKPKNFTVATVQENIVTLKWNMAEDGRTPAQRYLLSCATITPTDRSINVPSLTATVNDLTPLTLYSFSLQACNLYGCGDKQYLQVQTLEQMPPTAPQDVKALSVTSTSVTLSWLPGAHSSKPISKYILSYQKPPEPFSWPVDVYSTPYTLENLQPFTTYIFKVQSCINGSTSLVCSMKPLMGYTEMTEMAAPSEVCCLSVRNTNTEQVQLEVRWGPPTNLNGPNVTYKIFYKLRNETKWNVVIFDQDKLNSIQTTQSPVSFLYTLNDVHGPLYYDVIVNAGNLAGSTNSSTVQVKTDEEVPSQPFDLKCVSNTWSSIVITWQPPLNYLGRVDNYHLTVVNLADPKPTASVTKEAGETIIGSLAPHTEYRIDIIATVIRRRDGSLLSSGNVSCQLFTAVKPLPTPSSAPRVDIHLVIVTIICIVVMLCVVLFTLCYCRKKNVFGVSYKSTFYVLPDHALKHSFRISMRNQVQRQPVGVADFARYMAQMHADSDYMFSEEYGSLHPRRPGLSYEHSSNLLNKPKNRYPDIVAYDHSRVRLKSIDGMPASNYINANFVDGFKRSNAFIATQAPLTRTFEDFWRMVVEQGARVIIMLTNLMERGRRKCDQYWPNEGTQRYGTIAVQTTEERKYAYFTVRTFLVYDEAAGEGNTKTPGEHMKREIKQFHFTDWPDFDVPRERSTIMTFIWWIRRYADQFQKPLVCHCSAGVGRTGTLIVLDAQIRRVDEEKTIDIYNFLRHIRAQRNYLVQQERQYVFIHDALLDYVMSGRTELPCSKLKELVLTESFFGLQGKEKSKVEIEWEAITASVLGDYEMQVGRRPCNIPKNRDQFVIPVDCCRVRLSVRAATEDTDYINANYIDTFLDKKSLIATQAPLRDTVEDFWRMIWENYSVIVVSLLSEQDCLKEDFTNYLPREDCNPINFGVFEIRCTLDSKVSVLRKRELEITHRVPWGESEKRKVHHFQFLNWSEDSFPEPRELFEFMETVKEKQEHLHSSKSRVDKAPTVIHCSCGIVRSGIYGVLCGVKEQLEDEEGVVDVFTSVKITRRQRPHFIQTIEQYQYCYKATVEFNQLIRRKNGMPDLIDITGTECDGEIAEPASDVTSVASNDSIDEKSEDKGIISKPENGHLGAVENDESSSHDVKLNNVSSEESPA